MLLVSAGDFFGGADDYNQLKCQFIARMMGYFGYDAVALGEMDLNFGLDAITEDNAKNDINILCANLFRKKPGDVEPSVEGTADTGGEPTRTRERPTAISDEPAFPAYRIIERNGVRFGIIGVMAPSAKNERMTAESGSVEALTYVIRDPIAILRGIVPIVKAQSDVVVLLAHMVKSELDRVLEEVGGVDVAVIGHSRKPSVTPEPVVLHDVPVFMASHQGQYIGRALLNFDSANKLSGYENEIRLLDESIADDPEVALMVSEFEEENRRYQKELFVKKQLRRQTGESGPQDIYLGVANCQRCHPDAFEAYTGTRHAQAYATLSELFKHRDSGCVPCHSTGYGMAGGFTGSRSIGSISDLVDVQCEACHGPGEQHTRDGRYREIAKQSCTRCHTKEQDPEFNFAEAWENVAH
ncbi:MAG: hypothetical protein JSW58_02800 [Candidatus Latescibacterota bacterium]|nr:MAG: hypothetical protein JSW58_02800 [Candidatus Latescibacterota bacterium]